MRRCPKCGFLLNEKDRYCENCGEDCSAVEDSETAETVSLNEPKNEQKEKLKKQWKIAGIVFGAFVLVFAGILALVLFPLNNSSHSDTKTKTKSESSLTEPTTVDNSIDGKGYYYFDNKFNEETVDKFMSAFDDEGSMGDLGLGVEFDDFKYDRDYLLLGKKVTAYKQVDFNGKTGTYIYADEEDNVVGYSLIFYTSLLNNITTDGVYKVKQTAGRIADWLYALSDYKSYDSCESTAKHLFSEFVSDADEGNTNGNYYYNGYTMFYVTQSGQAAVTFLLTDSDFVEKNGGDVFEYATGSSEETEDSSNADDTSNTEESATAKSGKVSDSEIKKAEELLKKEPFGTDEQSDGSLDMFNVDKDEGFACIGWKKKEKPELYEILNSIKIGDIIYIKALPFNSKSMKIKAVGIVTAEPKNTNTHHGYEECENEIGVKWLNSDINKLIDVDDGNLNARKGSVFVETNSEYIKKIISLI